MIGLQYKAQLQAMFFSGDSHITCFWLGDLEQEKYLTIYTTPPSGSLTAGV